MPESAEARGHPPWRTVHGTFFLCCILDQGPETTHFSQTGGNTSDLSLQPFTLECIFSGHAHQGARRKGGVDIRLSHLLMGCEWREKGGMRYVRTLRGYRANVAAAAAVRENPRGVTRPPPELDRDQSQRPHHPASRAQRDPHASAYGVGHLSVSLRRPKTAVGDESLPHYRFRRPCCHDSRMTYSSHSNCGSNRCCWTTSCLDLRGTRAGALSQSRCGHRC